MTVRRLSRTSRRRLLVATCGVLGAVATGALLPNVSSGGAVGPGDLSLHLAWGGGGTALQIPPLGQVLVDSHRLPLRVEARVESIDIERAQQLATDRDPTSTLERDARAAFQGLLLRFVLWAFALAVATGVVVGLIMPERRWLHLGAGVGGGVVAVLLLLAAVWIDYDVDAFAEPRFEGALERAPELLDAVEREYGNLQGLQDRAQVLASQLQILAQQAANPALLAESPREVRILHVSDIHLNPVGLEVAANLAEQFDVEAILDTGDLTSYGLPLEANIGALLEQLPVPYYFVPGNHDSAANRAAIARRRNVTVIDKEIVEIGGVRILGIPDPRYSVDAADGGVSGPDARAARERAAGRVADLVEALDPDVLAVAGLQLGSASTGLVPLVISGDLHRRTEEVVDGTGLLTVGSTGAGGLGSFTVDTDQPYEAEILRFVDGRLAVLDYVTLSGLSGNFTIDRIVYEAPDADTDTDADPGRETDELD